LRRDGGVHGEHGGPCSTWPTCPTSACTGSRTTTAWTSAWCARCGCGMRHRAPAARWRWRSRCGRGTLGSASPSAGPR
ncbi:hypothetical protein CFC21_065522, partial [Triticum aestivum]